MSIPERPGRTGFFRRFGRAALPAAALAAALLLAPGAARAQTPSDPRNQCGALSSGAATCADQAYGVGIRYDAADGWSGGVAGDVSLTVTGGSSTTITAPASPPNAWTDAAIVIRTAAQGSGDSTSRVVTLAVGSGDNDVAITEDAVQTNHGVQVHQFGKGADSTTVTVGGGVTIGAASAPMKHYGVFTLVTESDNTGDHSITSAATIHSTEFGILMDARGSGDASVANSGSITTSTTGGAYNKSGIRVLDWSGGFGDDRTADTTTTVENSGSIATSASSARGIHVDADGLGLYRIVNSGTIATSGTTNADGIHVNAHNNAGAADARAVSVEHSGDITTAAGTGSHGIAIFGVKGRGNLSVESSGDITTAGMGAHGIIVSHDSTEGGGAIRVAATEGDIKTTGGENAHGIHVSVGAMNAGGAEIVSAAGIDAAGRGISVWNGGAGDFRVENAGTITAGLHGIFSEDSGKGDVVIVNRGDVTGRSALFARKVGAGAGDVLIRHEAGEIRSTVIAPIAAYIGRWRQEDSLNSPAPENEATARVEVAGGKVLAPEATGRPAVEVTNNEGGSAEIIISEGAALTSMHNAGAWAYLSDRRNANGRVRIEQGGAITALQGVYATVPHPTRARAADEPLIDIAWTGSFAWAGRSWPEGRTGGADSASVAHAIERAQERQAGEVMRTAEGLAGIDAEVLSWRILNRVATAGDDPGEIVGGPQAAALLDVASTDAAVKARAEAIVARFRAVLTTGGWGRFRGATPSTRTATAPTATRRSSRI